jgi:hypothetical protein
MSTQPFADAANPMTAKEKHEAGLESANALKVKAEEMLRRLIDNGSVDAEEARVVLDISPSDAELGLYPLTCASIHIQLQKPPESIDIQCTRDLKVGRLDDPDGFTLEIESNGGFSLTQRTFEMDERGTINHNVGGNARTIRASDLAGAENLIAGVENTHSAQTIAVQPKP